MAACSHEFTSMHFLLHSPIRWLLRFRVCLLWVFVSPKKTGLQGGVGWRRVKKKKKVCVTDQQGRKWSLWTTGIFKDKIMLELVTLHLVIKCDQGISGPSIEWERQGQTWLLGDYKTSHDGCSIGYMWSDNLRQFGSNTSFLIHRISTCRGLDNSKILICEQHWVCRNS